MENPFKFGTIVEAEYFTDRIEETAYIEQFLNSANHLVLISPRRFGKSSLVVKAVKSSRRKYIMVNLQRVVSVSDFSAKLLKEFFKNHPFAHFRHLISHFRVIPTLSTNPLTGAIDVSFHPGADSSLLLEDVFTLLEKSHSEANRLIVVLDEFQEIMDMDEHMDRQLRAIMQEHKNINYILLGSQESLMSDIFENKKSPFYHFGELMRLKKIPRSDFFRYLYKRLESCFPETCGELANRILDYTDCHPYYSQQLAANIWQVGTLKMKGENPLQTAISHIVSSHSLDYERLWMNLKRTNRWILRQLATGESLQVGEYRTSTIYSALKRLQKDGYVIYTDRYELEDPFFKQWILESV